MFQENENIKDPLLGTVVGRFRLVRKLGSGGMSHIYLGEHIRIGSKVAVKVLHERFSTHEGLVQRFLGEARAANLIEHESIIHIFDMGVLPPHCYYLMMEYLEGGALSELTGKPVGLAATLSILTQVCDALQAAHGRGVVHCDLKPENIFLMRRARGPATVKLLDFGAAKILAPERPEPQSPPGDLIGTPEYMAPEQWYGYDVDGRTDLYALGAIAYELLTGRPPFGTGRISSLMHAHLMDVPPAPHELNPEVPVALSLLILRAMSKLPDERFRDAEAMRAALEQSLAAPSAPSPSAPERPSAAPVAASLSAQVILQPGAEPVAMACTDLCRGGVFLRTEVALPPMLSRVSLTLQLGDQRLCCFADVVRHVSAAQAASWRTRPGFAVQFHELSEQNRAALEYMLRGETPVPITPVTTPDEPKAEAMLGVLLKRGSNDPYALLALPVEASFDDVHKQARLTLSYLESLANRPLSARQAQVLAQLRSRMEKAAQLLSRPPQRLEHDAWRGNYAGVARCISSGIPVAELDLLQARFLAEHPGAEAREQIHARTAMSWQLQGRVDLALLEYEKALTANPLRLTLQQRYWLLKQRGVAPSLTAQAAQEASASSGG
jgi:tRNA A-37 threonylcarbamoyl transferase component Bud32